MNGRNLPPYVVLIYQGIVHLIGGLVFSYGCFFIKGLGKTSSGKLILLPFVICGVAFILRGIVLLIRGLQLRKISKNGVEDLSHERIIEENTRFFQRVSFTSKLYLFGFFLFWFGFLVFFDYLAIKSWNDGGVQLFLFSLLFWYFGIRVLYKRWKQLGRKS